MPRTIPQVDVVWSCDLRGRVLSVGGRFEELIAGFSPGSTLAADLVPTSAGRVFEMLLTARQEGLAAAWNVMVESEAGRIPLQMVTLGRSEGLLVVADRQRNLLRQVLLEGELAEDLPLAARLEELLAESLAPPASSDDGGAGGAAELLRLLAEKNREIAALKAEIARLTAPSATTRRDGRSDPGGGPSVGRPRTPPGR